MPAPRHLAFAIVIALCMNGAKAQDLAAEVPKDVAIYLEIAEPAHLVQRIQSEPRLMALLSTVAAPLPDLLTEVEALAPERMALAWRAPGLLRVSGAMLLVQGVAEESFRGALEKVGLSSAGLAERRPGLLALPIGEGFAKEADKGPRRGLDAEGHYRRFRAELPNVPIFLYGDSATFFPPIARSFFLNQDEPFAALLLGTPLATLRRVREFAVGIEAKSGFALRARARCVAPRKEDAFLKPSDEPLPAVQSAVSLALTRSLQDYWEHRADLSAKEAESTFLQVQAQVSLFLGQTSFEDLLAALGRGLDLHLLRVKAADANAADVPAFAFTAALRDAAVGREVIIALQMLTAFANLQRQELGEPRLLMSTELLHGVPAHVARWSAPPRADDPLRWIAPTVLWHEDRIVLASHPAAAEAVLEAVQGARTRPRAAEEELLVAGPELVQLLRGLEDLLLRRIAIESNLGRNIVRARWDQALGLLEGCQTLRLAFAQQQDASTIDLEWIPLSTKR